MAIEHKLDTKAEESYQRGDEKSRSFYDLDPRSMRGPTGGTLPPKIFMLSQPLQSIKINSSNSQMLSF